MSISIRNIPPNATNEVDQILYQYFLPEFRSAYVEIGEDKYCLPSRYKDYAEKIENFEVFDTDTFVVSHPKTGTTWTQEMVWCIANNCDFEAAQEHIMHRFPFFEVSGLFEFEKLESESKTERLKDSVEYTKNRPHPRFIKTHLPWDLLPKSIRTGAVRPKIIHTIRNPKDTCVSYYYHCISGEGFTGNFDQYVTLFMGGRACYGPFFPHLKSVLKELHRDNVLLIHYEDLKTNIEQEIKKVASFLGKSLTESQVQALAKHLDFDTMKNNNAVNYDGKRVDKTPRAAKFMRAGIIGSYKADMTPEIIEKMDRWTESEMKGVDFKFKL